MSSFRSSIAAYEALLKSRLATDFVAPDLQDKHRKMRKSALVFLRGTCWRWADLARSVCPDLASATTVLAVGDAHIENFGLWRDLQSRLVQVSRRGRGA